MLLVLVGSCLIVGGAIFWLVSSGEEGGGKGGAARDQRAGFAAAKLDPATPIESIAVTITVGAKGADLDGPVDLHLGIGFPLRLYPLGGTSREPAFAAYPQKSTLESGAKAIKAGGSATFEFSAKAGDKGQDTLSTTPHLLRDLTVGDIQRLGFSSQAKTDWVLAGYRVEVNGELLASNDAVDARAVEQLTKIRENLQKALPQQEALARQAGDLQAYVATGLASEADKVELNRKNTELAKTGEPIAELLGQTAGYLPWFVETAFQPAPLGGTPITALRVTLATGGGERPGTRNPLYLWASGRKYLLASEADPLADEPEPQQFQIAPADLAVSPLTQEKLQVVGIGVIGNDQKFSAVPDRAKVQRVVLETAGRTIYDSELKPGDRRTLGAVWLIPPAHRDDAGTVVENPATTTEWHLWKSGAPSPAVAAETTPGVNFPALKIEPAPLTKLAEAPQAFTVPGVLLPPDPPSKGFGTPSPLVRLPGSTGASSVPPPGVTPGRINVQPWPPLGALGSALLSPPIRRASPNTAGLPQIPRVIFPTPKATPGAKPTPALTPVAPPVVPVPVISNVRINPATPIVCDGDTPVVFWQVTGNATQVASYQVELFAVLPHKNPALLNTPVARTVVVQPVAVATANTAQIGFALMSPIQLSAIASQLTGAEALYLYVQPKVTPLGADGKALGGGGLFGSLLPIFPAKTKVSDVALLRGRPPVGLAAGPASYQIDANAWTPLAPGDPLAPKNAWAIQTETNTHAALTFATPENAWPATTAFASFNTGFRPTNTNQEQIAIKFEGWVPVPTTAKGLRAVAHVGFIGGAAPATVTGVLTRAEVSTGPLAYDLNGNYTGNNLLFMLQSDGAAAPIPLPPPAGAPTPLPMMLLDVPIRFDRMAANNVAVPGYPLDPVNPTAYGAVTFNQAALPAPNAGRVYVTLTYMFTLGSPNTTDAVGIFGVRLVPDNTP